MPLSREHRSLRVLSQKVTMSLARIHLIKLEPHAHNYQPHVPSLASLRIHAPRSYAYPRISISIARARSCWRSRWADQNCGEERGFAPALVDQNPCLIQICVVVLANFWVVGISLVVLAFKG